MMTRFALLLLTAAGFAQGSDRSGLSIRFRALAFDEPILGASYLEDGTLRRIDIPNNAFTGEVSYRGANTLRFVTIDEETINPQPVTPEMAAATQRLRQAKATTLQVSDELAQIDRLLDTLNLQATEQGRKPTEGDLARIEALNLRIRDLSDMLAMASKETEDANLQILRLDSKPRKPQPAPDTKSTKARPTSTPTAEHTFQKDGAYLLLFSSAGNGHQILAMDDAEGVFPYGSQQFINLTGKDLRIRYPDRNVALKANARVVVKNPVADHRYASAEILALTEDGPTVAHVYRALQRPDVRTLIFLMSVDDEPNAVLSKGIEDRRPPAPKDGK